MSDFNKKELLEGSYFRDLYASLTYFFYDRISVKKISGEKVVVQQIPIIPRFSSNENYAKEFYINKSKSCSGFPNFKDIPNIIPSGKMSIDSGINIDSSGSYGNSARIKRMVEDESNPFYSDIKNVYSRDRILNVDTRVLISIKCSSFVERFNILENVVKVFNSGAIYYFNTQGINGIPCMVSLPDAYTLETKKQFKFGEDDNNYMIDFNLDVDTYWVLNDGRVEIDEKLSLEKVEAKTKFE